MPQIRRRTSHSRVTRRIGPLKEGRLSKFGYVHVNDLTEAQRHTALNNAVKKLGSLTVWKMVNVLYVYNKSRSATCLMFKKDRDWIKRTFGIESRS